MNGSTKSKIKKIISLILALFLSLTMALSVLVLVIQNTVLNPDYLRNQLSTSHYYDNVITEVEEKFSSYASASGFDDSFFKTVLNINDVQLKVNESLSVLYGESDVSIGVSDFQNTLYSKLVQNVKDRKIALNTNTDKAVRLLAQTCAETYLQYVSIPYAKEISMYFPKLKHILFFLQIISLSLAVALVLLIFFINHWKHRAVRAYIYAMAGTTLMLTVLPVVFLISGFSNRIALISKSLYELAVCYLNGIAFLSLEVALIFVVALVLLSLLYRYFLKKAKNG